MLTAPNCMHVMLISVQTVNKKMHFLKNTGLLKFISAAFLLHTH